MYLKGLMVAGLIGCVAPMALAQLNSTDKTFAKKLSMGNNYEIKAAHIAENTTHNQKYKNYAQMIVADHMKAEQQLKSTIANVDPSFQLPTNVSSTQRSHLEALKNAGNNFDTTYRSQMISTHRATLNLIDKYLAHPHNNTQLKKDAQQFIPVFKKHLRHAKNLPKK